MFTLITVSVSLFFIGLTGWTITTYLVKEDSQKFIQEELRNLFDICKVFIISLRNMIKVLAKYSFSSYSSEATLAELNGLNEQPLSFVQPVEATSTKKSVNEDVDNALSGFCPKLIEVITEEEEKVA